MIEKCPICSNHCPKNDLKCGRGEQHFNDSKSITLQEKVIMDLRKCGHLLHHNRDLDANELLAVFSSEELNTLHELLSKIGE